MTAVAGAAGSPVKVTVRSPAAVAYLAQAPGALGLARAYVAGHLDLDGDMYEAPAGAYTGARLQPHLPDALIRRLVGVLVIAIGVRYLWSGLG